MEWHEGFSIDASGNFAEARLLPRPECSRCRGSGRVEVEQGEALTWPTGNPQAHPMQAGASLRSGKVMRVLRCRCQMLPDRVAMFNRARIPSRHGACTLESFRSELDGRREPWTITRRWLDTFDPQNSAQQGMVWLGEPGRGKTHLMVGALRELIFRYGVECRFVEFTHLISSIREGFDRGDGEAVTLTPLVQVPILAIDELGKGRKTEFELSVIDEIITRRYNARRRILATTNFPLRGNESRSRSPQSGSLATGTVESLDDRLGERVYSRLYEVVNLVPVSGEDFRKTRGRF